MDAAFRHLILCYPDLPRTQAQEKNMYGVPNGGPLRGFGPDFQASFKDFLA
jgi:hypothetical protein